MSLFSLEEFVQSKYVQGYVLTKSDYVHFVEVNIMNNVLLVITSLVQMNLCLSHKNFYTF